MLLLSRRNTQLLILLAYLKIELVSGSAEDIQVCQTNNDCTDYPYQLCNIEEGLQTGVCKHKGIFPITQAEGWGLIVFSLLMSLANIAGTGGGSVAIPVLMAFFHFNTKPAIAISSVPILMATAVRFMIDYK